ncbi:hypothetical protein GCM10022403_091740 [Streptomyces coacervatus]|uniref:Transposase n=1 Tax=Streptomyces coacervatus TaxID=647381 RepID=A0ABP7JJ92_9ACTN
MSRIFSSYESSGGGVFVLRRAIAAGSLLKRERYLTRTIVDRGTDNADEDLTSALPPGVDAGYAIRCGRTSPGNFADDLHACIQWQDRQENRGLNHRIREAKGRTCPWVTRPQTRQAPGA